MLPEEVFAFFAHWCFVLRFGLVNRMLHDVAIERFDSPIKNLCEKFVTRDHMAYPLGEKISPR